MNTRERLFSKRMIIVMSAILLVAIVTTGLLLAVPCQKIAFMVYLGVITPIQESVAQRRLLSATDHEALLEECRKLSKQIASENANTGLGVPMTPVPVSKLSEFPTIKKGGGQVTVYSNGGATIEWGGTWRHFGVHAYPSDLKDSSSRSYYGNCELVAGLWYYDDLYNRDENYDKVVEQLLQRNEYRIKRETVARLQSVLLGDQLSFVGEAWQNAILTFESATTVGQKQRLANLDLV